jgi:hypothetical protein
MDKLSASGPISVTTRLADLAQPRTDVPLSNASHRIVIIFRNRYASSKSADDGPKGDDHAGAESPGGD